MAFSVASGSHDKIVDAQPSEGVPPMENQVFMAVTESIKKEASHWLTGELLLHSYLMSGMTLVTASVTARQVSYMSRRLMLMG